MKRLLLILIFLPSLALAQSIPAMDRRVTLQGPTGLNWAMSQKADTNKGVLTNPSESNGTYAAPSITGGTSTNQSLTTPSVTGGTVSGTDESAGVAMATSGTTSRTHALHYSDTTNVMDFGAVASPTVDNTAAFQAAINAACAKVTASSGGTAYPSTGSTGAGDVFIPQGRYGVTGPIEWTCPVHVHGAGPSNTTIVWMGLGSGPLFDMAAPLTDSNRYWYDGAVYDLSVVNGGSQTGDGIKITQCNGCDVFRVNTYDLYRSVVVFAGAANGIHDFNFRQGHEQTVNGVSAGMEAFSVAIEYYGSDNNGGTGCTTADHANCTTRGDILSIFNGHVDAALDGTHEPIDCLYIHDFAATTWVKNMTCNQVRNGADIRCDNSTGIGQCPQFMNFDRLEVETNNSVGTNHNYGIAADNFAHLDCISCQLFGSQAGPNLITTSATRFPSGNFGIFGGKFQAAQGACAVFRSDDTTVEGGLFTDCGLDEVSADQWGIQFIGSTNNSVSHAQFCHDGVGATSPNMRPVGIDETTSFTLVDGSIIQNCAGGSTNLNTSTNTHNLIVNEIGP
ncbi:hypothetical protein J2D73_19195 [Acetobacter sacchari]|uniref:Rhamnogalacturonase A/B/Epimerase-like pectate lyase domain-containing protein n=1 Tax=Acetobacter sacchari TaxID=2661687 RepID=A0ABS3M145_9PROT|nr:glycosyl hydrolase family 28-related protein [Acetobacter sacchari]MBO1361912.1 hypothetical protein [Acetobacter sacchari]